MARELKENPSRWEARRRMHAALVRIENAQREIMGACEALCALTPLCDDHERVGKLYDAIKAEWHRLNEVRNGDRFQLDPDAEGALAAKLKAGPGEAWLRDMWGPRKGGRK